MPCVCRGWLVGALGQPARPGTLGVRPLTGSVAAADGRRRQGAETSVAHAAACLPRKGLHTSQWQQQWRPCLELIGIQAPGRQAGRQASWKTICQEELPLSPKVTRQQLSPEEPGWLSLGLGGIWGDLWYWGGTSHSLPSRYLKSRSADTDNKWECPHQGCSRHSLPMLAEPPLPSEDSHTQIGRSLAAWQPQGASGSPQEQCPGLLLHKLW